MSEIFRMHIRTLYVIHMYCIDVLEVSQDDNDESDDEYCSINVDESFSACSVPIVTPKATLNILRL